GSLGSRWVNGIAVAVGPSNEVHAVVVVAENANRPDERETLYYLREGSSAPSPIITGRPLGQFYNAEDVAMSVDATGAPDVLFNFRAPQLGFQLLHARKRTATDPAQQPNGVFVDPERSITACAALASIELGMPARL